MAIELDEDMMKLLGFFTGIKLQLIAAAGVLLGIIALLFKVFYMGKQSAKVDAQSKQLRRARVARKIENDINSVPDSELRDRLRESGWLRK